MQIWPLAHAMVVAASDIKRACKNTAAIKLFFQRSMSRVVLILIAIAHRICNCTGFARMGFLTSVGRLTCVAKAYAFLFLGFSKLLSCLLPIFF